MGCPTASNWQPCGGSGLLDRSSARQRFYQAQDSGTSPNWAGGPGEVRSGSNIPATSPRVGAETEEPEEEMNIHQLWFMLPEQEKEEFGVAFSDVVMTLFRVLTEAEDR